MTFHHDLPIIEGCNISIVVLAHFDDDFEENSIAVEEEMTFPEVETIESVGILYQPHIFHHGRCCEEHSSEVGQNGGHLFLERRDIKNLYEFSHGVIVI